MLRSLLLSLAVAGTGLVAGQSVLAASTTASVPVTAAVAANCVLSGVGPVTQNGYDPTNTTQNWSLNKIYGLTCTKGAIATLTLSQGNNTAAGSSCDAPARQMKAADGSLLKYNYYYIPSSGPFFEWGCGSANMGAPGASTTGLTGMTIITQFWIPRQQDVPAGSYTDQLTITVNY
jgi:spore coat protein U-like protein